MQANPHFDFSHLSVADRIQLAEDLWDSIPADTGVDTLPLTPEQRSELDRRLQDALEHPGQSIPWNEVRLRLYEGLRRPS